MLVQLVDCRVKEIFTVLVIGFGLIGLKANETMRLVGQSKRVANKFRFAIKHSPTVQKLSRLVTDEHARKVTSLHCLGLRNPLDSLISSNTRMLREPKTNFLPRKVQTNASIKRTSTAIGGDG